MTKRRTALLVCMVFVYMLPIKSQSLIELCDRYGMETPVIRSEFPDRYLERNLNFTMTAGVERTPGGRIWNCAFGGEDGAKAYLFLTWSDDNGNTWSDVKFVVDGHDDSHPLPRRTTLGNLWTDPLGRLWLFFDQAMTVWDGRGGNWCAVCENPNDEKPVWSEPRYIGIGGTLNKPIVLSSGEWVLPVSVWSEGCFMHIPKGYQEHPLRYAYPELLDKWGAHTFVSVDQGKTWEQRGLVQCPHHQFDEQNYVELADGRLWMTIRTKKGMYECFSSDKGYTWTTPRYYLPHPSTRHIMCRLSSGAILMVRHGNVYENTKHRCELRAFLSYDEGKTWKGNLLLDERSNISYPSGFQDKNGDIYVSYDYERYKCGTIYMAKFTEKDILNGRLSRNSYLKKVIFQPGDALVMKKSIILPSAENPYIKDVADFKALKKKVIKARKKGGDNVPEGAVHDSSAPGGYYWPLKCGIDVAGADLQTDPSKTLNDYHKAKNSNPCPYGWSLPTEYQLRRMFRLGVYEINVTEDSNDLYWIMIDGKRSEGDIFGTEYEDIVNVVSKDTHPKFKKSVWRLVINRETIPSLEVSHQARTRKLGTGRDRSVLRCVRDMK